MKSKFYILVLACFFHLKVSAQSWIEIGHGLLPWGYSVDDVSAVGDDVVWVSASLRVDEKQPSVFFLSVDGGQHWASHYFLDCLHCKAVDLEAVDDTTAWLTTYSIEDNLPRLFRTTDGGQTWKLITLKPGANGYIQLYDDQHMSCYKDNEACWTGDGGEHWESGIIPAHSAHFRALTSGPGSPFGDTTWLEMAGYGDVNYPGEARLILARDYGRTFEFIPTGIDSIAAIHRVLFTDAQHGIMWYWKWEYLYDFDFGIGHWTYCYWECKDSIATTEDGGHTWISISQPLAQLNLLYAIPGMNGAYITTNHNSVGWTHNSGQTWQTRKLHEYISCTDFTSPTTGYMGINANNFSDPLLLKWNGDFTTSVEAPLERQKLTIGPNPTSGLLHFYFEDETISSFHVSIFDSNGKTVMAELVTGKEMSVEKLPSGLYFVKVKTGEDSHIYKIIR